MAAAPHAREARVSDRTEGTSMIADVRLFRHGACAGVLAETPDVATIVQPAYRGSAAELFLPALLVARRDPDAVILALRADETHDGPVAPCLARAIRAVDLRPELTVLVGARPRTTRAPDGFVEPGSPLPGLEDLS